MTAPRDTPLFAARSARWLRRALHPVFAWLVAELRAVAAWITEPQLWALVSVGLVLWALAYAQPYGARLDFGGDPASGRRYDDAPYLSGFNDPEPADKVFWYDDTWRASGQPPYRWAAPSAEIALPGIGAGRWLVRVRASAAQPVTSQWSDGETTMSVPVTGVPRIYYLLARSDGDLTLRFRTPPHTASGDARALGFVAYRAAVQPLAQLGWPPLAQLGLLASTIALAYGTARRLTISKRPTLLAGLAVVAGLAAALAYYRLALTSFTPTLLAIAAACYALALFGRSLLTHSPIHSLPRSLAPPLIIGLILLAFALRLGVLHPQRQVKLGDTGLNANNISGLVKGQMFFTEDLPGEVGGIPAPYPPGQYLVFAPLRLLIGGDVAARRVIEIGGALWDALVVGLLWYVLRRANLGERAALIGAALYIVAVPLLNSFVIGEYANIFGQGLSLPLLVFLAFEGPRLRERAIFVTALVLMLMAVLGHLGVTISVALLLVWLGAVWLAARAQRRAVLPLALVGVSAAALVALLYYSAFAYPLDKVLVSRPSAESAAAPTMFAQIESLVARRVSISGILNPLLVALGIAGGVLLALRRGARPLCLLLVAWWGATLISLVPPLGASLRWPHLLYPALCLGAGPLLAALWRRGVAGRAVTIGVLAALFWAGAVFWVTHLADYLHK